MNNRYKELKKYLKEIKKTLKIVYNPVQAKDMADAIRQSAQEYFDENPDATFSQFQEDYGTVSEVLSDMVDLQEIPKLAKKTNIKRYIKAGIIAILVMIVSAEAYYWILIYKSMRYSDNIKIVKEKTIYK